MQPSTRAAGHRASSSTWPCPRTFTASPPLLSPARAVLAASKSGSPTTPRRQQHHSARNSIYRHRRKKRPPARGSRRAADTRKGGNINELSSIRGRIRTHSYLGPATTTRERHTKNKHRHKTPHDTKKGGSEGKGRVFLCKFTYSSVNQNTLVNSYHAIALCNWLLFALLVLYKNR